MTQLTTVKLYGELGELFGKEFKLAVRTPAQAIRLLSANFRTFEAYLYKNSRPGYHVYVGDRAISADELGYPSSYNSTIKIVPVISGSSDNPITNIILGSLLVMAAPWAAAMVTGGLSGGAFLTGAIANVGWGLALSGVSQVLFAPPTPDAPAERPENKPSYLFNGAVNTIKQGNPVPVGYGKLRVGSQVISAGITTEQMI